MLNYPSVQLWFKKTIHSERCVNAILAKLSRFFEAVHEEPSAIMEEWRRVRYDYREREMFLDKWAERIEAYYYGMPSDHSPLYRKSLISLVASWFKHNKIPVDLDLQDRVYVKYHNRDVTKEEIHRILDHASLRDRTFFLMMAESGQRPYTLVQLRYKHVKEDFEAEKVPMKIALPAELIKDRVGQRFTFIGEDGFAALKEYLTTRLPLDDEALIFAAERSAKTNKPFLSPETFSSIFGRLVLKLGLDKRIAEGKPKPLRLYCLRKYFRNQIKVADTAYREFWMAHTFGTDEHYLTRDVEKHRQEYTKAYPNLRVFTPNIPKTIKELRAFYESKLEMLKPLSDFVESFKDQEELKTFLRESPRPHHEVAERLEKGTKYAPLSEQEVEGLLLKLLDESEAVREVLRKRYKIKEGNKG